MAKVLKSGGGLPEPTGGAKVVKRSVYEGGRTAEEVVEQAQAEAAEIVAAAERKRDAVLEEARQTGYDRGLAEWNEAVAEVVQSRDANLVASEEQILRLAVRVAEKILGDELREDPQRAANAVAEALKSARQANNITIRVHPDASDGVEQRLDDLRAGAAPGAMFTVKGDESIALGGCVIQTEFGTVDAQLESQLRCLEDLLVREVRK